MTPIFDMLHRERFAAQCDKCKSHGWPVGWFLCADIFCIDY